MYGCCVVDFVVCVDCCVFVVVSVEVDVVVDEVVVLWCFCDDVDVVVY